MTRIAIAIALVTLLALAMPGVAAAEFGIAPGGVTIGAVDTEGHDENRAGAHPDRLQVGIELNQSAEGGVDGNLKDLAVELPAGFIGNPNAVPRCPRRIFDAGFFTGEECPAEARVGTATARIGGLGERTTPIFNVEPAPGQMAMLGFIVFGKVPIVMRLRPNDYGVTIEQTDFMQSLPLEEIHIELWGTPADHQEGPPLQRRPFLTLPTRCDGKPLAITVRVRSWQEPGIWHSANADTGAALTGCNELPFEPRVAFGLSNPVADAPTGAEVKIDLPESHDSEGRVESEMRKVTVAMPDGMSISPGGAAGLAACSDAELGLGMSTEATCPQSSRVGSVELVSAVLRAPLTGSVFVGHELPGDRFRLFVVAKGSGVEAKLIGSLHADPTTGRLTAELGDLPQVPLDSIALRFDGGPRALLTTPLGCGAGATRATFEPYSGGTPVQSSDEIAIGRNPAGPDCGTPPPFAPGFVAGTATVRAGHPTAFSVTLRRRDGEQSPDRFSVTFPPGLSAALGSVETCGTANAAAGTCPAASRIGSAVAEAGSGPAPAPLRGEVYLTGSYRRAPFGLALVFRAAIGPFDLGTLVVRAALHLDPRSGQVTVETDSLPRLIEGIPVRFQTIGLDIDRPGFLRNPTSCAPQAVTAAIHSTGDAFWEAASPFFLRGCDALRFQPALSLRLTNRSELHRHGNPGLLIGIRVPKGSTNLRRADIALPALLGLDISGLREICARREAMSGSCPMDSRVGVAQARTPLLGKPLSGAIYVVQPQGDALPDLWTRLDAQGIRVDLASETSVAHGSLESRFASLPDVPLSSLALRFASGDHGVISLDRDPCGRGRAHFLESPVTLEGQDGAYRRITVGVNARSGCGHSDSSPRRRSQKREVPGGE